MDEEKRFGSLLKEARLRTRTPQGKYLSQDETINKLVDEELRRQGLKTPHYLTAQTLSNWENEKTHPTRNEVVGLIFVFAYHLNKSG